ncbi:MAG: replication factor C small subunit [Candidatus Aenigmarchaeota archaeon]|nr:replication factor C small subunit [Candidatus Aenigmarchaeota archaeon]
MPAQGIWAEKYRPKRLRDIAGQQHIITRLEAFVQSRTLPHCLFAGPAGCGKTTTALAIAHELYGDAWKANFLELNSSDERGIDTVRVKVKDFARTISLGNTFKIICLDEADALTKDAQHALRRTMEKYSSTARFILSCNYSSRIIPPIQSRCAVFRFTSLKEADVVACLRSIAGAEGIPVSESAYGAVLQSAEGDMRKAINLLQGAALRGAEVTEETVYAIASRPHPDAVRSMLAAAMNGAFRDARNMLVMLLHEQGLAGEDIIKEIHNQIFELDIPDSQKLALIEKAGEYEFRLTEGSNPRIQLEALLAQFGFVKHEK